MVNARKMSNKITELLAELPVYLCEFLETNLPEITPDWWENCVIRNLTFRQQENLTRKRGTSLRHLDLAAMLRVFDFNWFEISSRKHFTFEHRHYLKEMISVRNRWAHIAVSGNSFDDIYRDIDTIERFAVVIDAEASFIDKVRKTKEEMINGVSMKNQKNSEVKENDNPKYKFSVGEIVSPHSNPELRGAVIKIEEGSGETRYNVFVDCKIITYYESQLTSSESPRAKRTIVSLDIFHAYLSALHINHPSTSNLYSLHSAKIDFIPYQFRPVLKFIRADRPRLLIADGVGVGKTIEAGLILRELQARREINSVLIICPKPLIVEKKWDSDMKRFEEKFMTVDGSLLRYCIDEADMEGVWPENYTKMILPYSLFDETLLFGKKRNNRSKQKGLLDLDPPPKFDLVIVDETHHIRNMETYTHKGVRFFCENAEAVLFLTATPIQLGSDDLFVLLNTLRPDLIIDRESFIHMSEPNPFITKAIELVRGKGEGWKDSTAECLKSAVNTSFGSTVLAKNPLLSQSYTILSQDNITQKDRIGLISKLESLHTFSSLINRTRRRDIGDFTIRNPYTVTVPFTEEQQKLHDELLRVQAHILSKLHENVNIKFLMSTIRRQAASCIFGLAPFVEDILTRRIDEIEWVETDPAAIEIDSAQLQSLLIKIQDVVTLAKKLGRKDPKFESLEKILGEKQGLENNKTMVFSSFRHTLSYIQSKLMEKGFRIGLVHGDTPDEERITLRERFGLPREDKDAIDTLLFSEVGCEGLDYQFCNCIVNYDLPWNPMRIEQRIGRIDRQGQESPTVAIYNLITPGTIDAEIYERCLIRIGVFERSIGGGEEILGDIAKELRAIGEDFTLSPEDRERKFKQLEDNEIRLITEKEKLEEEQKELFGIQLAKEQLNEEIEGATSFWLSPESLKNLVQRYLRAIGDKGQEYILGEKQLKTLRLSQNIRNFLLADMEHLPKQRTPVYREWVSWLKGGNPHIEITFDENTARTNRKALFITPIHPLVKQAAKRMAMDVELMTVIKTRNDFLSPGRYAFVIYLWELHGFRENIVLKPICENEEVTDAFFSLLKESTAIDAEQEDFPSEDIFKDLDAVHYKKWQPSRQKHKEEIKQIVSFKKESLSASHKARIAMLNEQLSLATNENIIRMRSSQIQTAENDYIRHLQDVENAAAKADITARPIAYGVIEIATGGNDAQ
jgi:ATP-dependent helicase HepA